MTRALWEAFTRARRAITCLLAVAMLALVCVSCGDGDDTSIGDPGGAETWSLLEQKARAWMVELEADSELEVCRLVIPAIDLDLPVWEMIHEERLEQGLGHWPETPLPGLGGHMVVSGHRSTYGAQFFRLGELELGDKIKLVLPYVVVEYEVNRILVVDPGDTEVVRPRGLEELSLTTCHPLGSEEFRLVVRAKAVLFSKGR